jgi:hypothetical protein
MHSTVCGRRRKRGVSRRETRREEKRRRASERASEARVYANVIAIIPKDRHNHPSHALQVTAKVQPGFVEFFSEDGARKQ